MYTAKTLRLNGPITGTPVDILELNGLWDLLTYGRTTNSDALCSLELTRLAGRIGSLVCLITLNKNCILYYSYVRGSTVVRLSIIRELDGDSDERTTRKNNQPKHP